MFWTPAPVCTEHNPGQHVSVNFNESPDTLKHVENIEPGSSDYLLKIKKVKIIRFINRDMHFKYRYLFNLEISVLSITTDICI